MAKDRTKLALLGFAALALSGKSGEPPEDPGNNPPNAAFTISVDGTTATLRAGNSSDPDGTIISYEWFHLGTKIGDGEQLDYNFGSPGDYPVTLRTTDDDGASDEVTRTVTIDDVQPEPPEQPDFDRTIRICGKPGSTAVVGYTVSVSGELRGSQDSLNPNDSISSDGKTADGQVIGQCDIYEFHGNITNFDWEAPLDVYVDGSKVDPYDLPGADGPPESPSWKSIERTDKPWSQIHIAIYQSKALTNRRGRNPEKSCVNLLRGAFNRTKWNYKIFYNLPTYDIPNGNEGGNNRDGFGWWRDMVKGDSLPVVAKDSTIMITDGRGGGLSTVGGNISWKGMRPMDRVYSYSDMMVRQTDASHKGEHGFLHEIGHALGQGHGTGDADKSHGGWATNDHTEKKWVRTPQVVRNPDTNRCGYNIPEREYDDVVRLNYWNPCSWEDFRVKPDGTKIRD